MSPIARYINTPIAERPYTMDTHYSLVKNCTCGQVPQEQIDSMTNKAIAALGSLSESQFANW
jgi:hypothetical protein